MIWTMLFLLSQGFAASNYSWNAADSVMFHKIGTKMGNGWKTGNVGQNDFLTYGPYVKDVPLGNSTVTFILSSDTVSLTTNKIVTLEVYNAATNEVMASRLVQAQDFPMAKKPREFDLQFDLRSPANLEFRVFVHGVTGLQHMGTLLRPDALTLNDLWNGKAHFEFQKQDAFAVSGYIDNCTASLVTLDGAWYAFNRLSTLQNVPEACKSSGQMTTAVRKSTDQGKTWSDPVVVAAPSADNKGHMGCAVTDGSAFFDPSTDTWHLLSQCLGPGHPWQLCHFTREGSSPMGTFMANPQNPVVKAGSLWKPICSGMFSSCSSKTVDEGTPQILWKSKDGYFYVSFHGFDYGQKRGSRGVARTKDFLKWETQGSDLPGDAMLTRKDCQSWKSGWDKEGCIGTGAASMIQSGGMNYILAEASDKSLLCVPGQKWHLGLLRSPELSSSGKWQNFSGNPYVTNLNVAPDGCGLQYMNFYRDRGSLFLTFGYYTQEFWYPNNTYKLQPGAATPNQITVK